MNNDRKKRNADIYAAAIVLLLLVIFGVQMKNIKAPNDVYFPSFLLSVLAVGFVLLLIKIWKAPDIRVIFSENKLSYVGIGILVSAIWIFLIPKLGFFTTSFLAMTFISLMVDPEFSLSGEKKGQIILKTALVNLAVIIIVAVMFRIFLDVPTPKGLFY